MKKIVLLLLVILILTSLLPACGAPQAEVNVWQETPTVPQKNESLTVFCMGDMKDSRMIELALNRYQELYPAIEVELMKPEYDTGDFDARDELYQQVAAQIMAGEGPDVFIIDDSIMDVEKLVRQGIFADMEPYFKADNFDWEPYHKKVMDGGVWNGKRFVIPLSYDFPLLITSRTALEETGFDMNACNDYQGFLEETTSYLADSSQTRQLFRNTPIVIDIAGYSGVSIADYDTQTVDLSSSILQSGFKWYKTVMEKCQNNYGDFFNDTALYGAAAVRDGQVLWSPPLSGALMGFYTDFCAIKTVDEAVMMPIRDMNGGIQAQLKHPVAVRSNSENLQNAYDFLKILLSSEIQCAFSGEELSVLNTANEYFFRETVQGKLWYMQAGTNGFVSTADPNQGVDWPTQEEFQQFVGFTQEITGTYYSSHLRLMGNMYPFVYENADYEETLQSAQQQMEIYITE